MMSASEYRAKADSLVRKADGALNEADVFELERMAQEWRRLADVADWQDALQKRLLLP